VDEKSIFGVLDFSLAKGEIEMTNSGSFREI